MRWLTHKAHPGKVQLLIAMVEYKTNLHLPRRGLCSSWLQDLPLGSRIPIKISAPTLYLPAERRTPVILVGPGTGVAPMRAFLEERMRQGAADREGLSVPMGS
jgi:sulfite reductase alpha subunit-like flavoprotein